MLQYFFIISKNPKWTYLTHAHYFILRYAFDDSFVQEVLCWLQILKNITFRFIHLADTVIQETYK